MSKIFILFFISLALHFEPRRAQSDREGKVFSLFNIVRFQNSPCVTTSSVRGAVSKTGTCFTKSECSAEGGNAEGTCAAGFGVCCSFVYSSDGSETNKNSTYFQNPGFPSSYAETEPISYTIKKSSKDVCSLRLDFETFAILGITSISESDGGDCINENFQIISSSVQKIPMICGINNGQHMYIELGADAPDIATLSFAFDSNEPDTSRTWNIKVSQIPCGAEYAAPRGCLQYFTGLTGRMKTFNYDDSDNKAHLANQQYSVCMRQEAGFCCVQYQVCPGEIDGFTLSSGNNPTSGASQGASCTLDFIAITGSTQQCQQGNLKNLQTNSRYCGNALSTVAEATENVPVCDCTAPFSVDIFTDDGADDDSNPNTVPSRGVCLEWHQVPCS